MELMKKPDHFPLARSVVIIVEDDPAVRNSLKFSLEIEGFDVRIYASGTDLLEAHDASSASCLVIDQKMPEITGTRSDRNFARFAYFRTGNSHHEPSERFGEKTCRRGECLHC